MNLRACSGILVRRAFTESSRLVRDSLLESAHACEAPGHGSPHGGTPLAQAVAAHLRSKGEPALDHFLVVLPTIEAGRSVLVGMIIFL